MTHHPSQRRPGQRRVATEETFLRMGKVNEEAIWYAICRKCGESLKGTLAQLKEHRCGETPRANA